MVSSNNSSRALPLIKAQSGAFTLKSFVKTLSSLAFAGGLAMAGGSALAQGGSQSEITLYTGTNAAPHASVKFSGASSSYGINDGSYSTEGWEAKSFGNPVYWGFRYTYWPTANSQWGYGLDINHSKLYAKEMPHSNISRLEFSDGMNTLMANLYRRYPNVQSLWGGEPYWGVGLGISYPHVELTSSSTNARTFEYQYTGFAAQAMVGLRYSINDKWLAFGELRTQYIPVEADLDGGGKLEVDFINNHFSLGVSRLF